MLTVRSAPVPVPARRLRVVVPRRVVSGVTAAQIRIIMEISGQRGKILYYSDGFSYSRRGINQTGHLHYRCSIRKCPGRCKVVGVTANITVRHTHEADIYMRERKEILANLKRKAAETYRPFQEIFEEETRRYPLINPPMNFKTHISMMRSARKAALPPIPATLREFGNLLRQPAIAARFGMAEATVAGNQEPFFRTLIEGTEDEGDIAVFASPFMVAKLQRATELHLDGTFKVVPRYPAINQLLTIHVIVGNHSFPAVYALMTKRSQAAYARLLAYVKNELAVNMAPVHIMADFEIALQNALEVAFPGAQTHGCHFHYGQAIWRKCQKLGLAAHYHEPQADARKFVKKVIALPFLPSDRIVEALGQLEATIDDLGPAAVKQKIRQLLRYIRRFWIAIIGVERLSVFGLNRRTNNNVESFHRNLLRRFRLSPNIWIFVEKLVMCDGTETRAAVLALEGQIIRRPRDTGSNNRRVREATRALADGLPVMDFLSRLAHHFDAQFLRLEHQIAAQNVIVDAQNVVDERNDVEPGDGVDDPDVEPGNDVDDPDVEMEPIPNPQPEPEAPFEVPDSEEEGFNDDDDDDEGRIRAIHAAQRNLQQEEQASGQVVSFELVREEMEYQLPLQATNQPWTEHPTPGADLSQTECWQQAAMLFQRFSQSRLEETRLAVDGEPVCKDCLENRATRVCLPCGHPEFCSECSATRVRRKSVHHYRQLPVVCPRCRCAVSRLQFVFL